MLSTKLSRCRLSIPVRAREPGCSSQYRGSNSVPQVSGTRLCCPFKGPDLDVGNAGAEAAGTRRICKEPRELSEVV
ncbi:hypothetical protein Anapl_06666 [Anas platyrhynchos]|uniref:Uncharacterized protein n=1 Tax=Anas platyrhynchos TaxID=8839 RepID=R0L4C6_ANAPL|nr:hypothetical protein Anapl_06666 [Anas platyrhynchos]